MSRLDFGENSATANRSTKGWALVLGIGVIAVAVTFSSTLAANININSGPIEFGQGVAQTTACDNSIVLAPYSTFVNEDAGEFKFSSISLSDVDSTVQENSSDPGCAFKTFSIKAYKKNGDLLSPSYSIIVSPTSFRSPDGSSEQSDLNSTNSSVTLTFTSPDIAASDVERITIESIDNQSVISGRPISMSTSCDTQITVTPYSTFVDGYYSMDRVDISNLDLTPAGDPSNSGKSQSEIDSHPGKYWDSSLNTWVRTCHKKAVILRAFTSSTDFTYLTAGNEITSPLYLIYNSNPLVGLTQAWNTGWGFGISTSPQGVLKVLGKPSQWEALDITNISYSNLKNASLSLVRHNVYDSETQRGVPLAAVNYFTLESRDNGSDFDVTCLDSQGNGNCVADSAALGW